MGNPNVAADSRGIGSLQSCANPGAWREAIGQVLRFALGWLVLGTIIAAASARGSDQIRSCTDQQYSYNKYYTLFPVILALGGVLISARKALILSGFVAMANLLPALAEPSTDSAFY